MRLIDEKGRLFGAINVIDFFVLTIISILVVSFFINLPLMVKAKDSNRANQEMLIKVLYRVPDQVALQVAKNQEIFKPGDKILMGMARVEKILEVKPVLGVTEKDTGFSDIIMLIRVFCTRLGGDYYCANMPIKLNDLFSFSNESCIFDKGVIIDVEKIGAPAVS
jgi:hypothetical protein